MPRAEFSGVKLQLVGSMAVTVTYPDVHSMETFLKIKEAIDGIVEPKLVQEDKGKPDKPGA